MNVEYLSQAEAAQLNEVIRSDTELSHLFADMMLAMTTDTDYDTVMISFDDEDTLRVVVKDSPYVIVMDEIEQSIELYINKDGELDLDGEYDFDDDGVETIVDIIASRILTDEADAD